MGWWKTGHNDDIAGDDPADAIVKGLSTYHEIFGTKPSFQELLDSLAMALELYGSDFLDDPESYNGQPMEALFEPPAPALVTRDDRAQLAIAKDSPVSSLVTQLWSTFRKIARQYRDSEVERSPRLSEILSVTAFPLRVKPERCLRDAEGLELKEFRVRV
jgi:hypothetical protein